MALGEGVSTPDGGRDESGLEKLHLAIEVGAAAATTASGQLGGWTRRRHLWRQTAWTRREASVCCNTARSLGPGLYSNPLRFQCLDLDGSSCARDTHERGSRAPSTRSYTPSSSLEPRCNLAKARAGVKSANNVGANGLCDTTRNAILSLPRT